MFRVTFAVACVSRCHCDLSPSSFSSSAKGTVRIDVIVTATESSRDAHEGQRRRTFLLLLLFAFCTLLHLIFVFFPMLSRVSSIEYTARSKRGHV